MKCPRCALDLRERTFESVQAHECSQCGGLWMDDAAFHAATESVEPDASWLDFDAWKDTGRFEASPSPRSCPACEGALAKLRYRDSQHTLEYCSDCHGLWLDPGDFESIVGALREELAGMSAGEFLEASLHEVGQMLASPGSALSEWKDLTNLLRLLKARVLADHPTLRGLVLGLQRGNPFD